MFTGLWWRFLCVITEGGEDDGVEAHGLQRKETSIIVMVIRKHTTWYEIKLKYRNCNSSTARYKQTTQITHSLWLDQ